MALWGVSWGGGRGGGRVGGGGGEGKRGAGTDHWEGWM